MISNLQHPLAVRILNAAEAVFGDTPTTQAVAGACRRFEMEVANINESRGIRALVLAIVGAKGQGKTWVARQLVLSEHVKSQLRSGDLVDDATTRLVWIGATPPDGLDNESEIYHHCPNQQLWDLGRPYVLLDTPGATDADPRAAQIASDALSLAPIKLLVIARDQIRSAATVLIAQRIDGSACIPVISSVDPEECVAGSTAERLLQSDLASLRQRIASLAPRVRLSPVILVPDFEISGDEGPSQAVLRAQLVARLAELRLDEISLSHSREQRLQAVETHLRQQVSRSIAEQLPQLANAVNDLNQETERLPQRVLESLLGSPQILQTGVRMRLRSQLVSDTYLLWFPYRSLLGTLSMTQGAWDRVMLAVAGSIPSLFGALTSWARNAQSSREFALEIQDGIRQRTQRQVEERLRPLSEQFHRTVWRLRHSSSDANLPDGVGSVRLSGIEELQNRSRAIFETAIAAHATPWWVAQGLAVVGMFIFWALMAGPIVAIYQQYLAASYQTLMGNGVATDGFPHPPPSLIFTSVILSVLPLLIYAMCVFTLVLSTRKVRRVASEIQREHDLAIGQLQTARIIQLQFEDRLLQQAEYLLNLARADQAS